MDDSQASSSPRNIRFVYHTTYLLLHLDAFGHLNMPKLYLM